MKTTRISLIVICAAFVLAACDQLPGFQTMAVVDLGVVAKATGREEAMQQQMDAARGELTTQLSEMAGNLEKQLSEEREKMGDSASQAQQQEYQQRAAQAQQQYAQTQALAQQKAQQFQSGLLTEFRDTVKEVAAGIAAERGAKAIIAVGPATLWFDASIDITDEVIAAMRAMPQDIPAESAAEPATDTPGETSGSPDAGQ